LAKFIDVLANEQMSTTDKLKSLVQRYKTRAERS
jgi:hypothetical protein